MTLEQLKLVRCNEIDTNTQELISKGFVFGGITFSLSLTAQINWSNFQNLPDGLFPLTVIGKNDEVYICQLADKLNFYFAALNGKNQYLQSGGELKYLINQCTTEEEVDAIIDNR